MDVVQHAMAAIEGGATVGQAAAEAGVSRRTVQRWCRAQGVVPRRGRPPREPSGEELAHAAAEAAPHLLALARVVAQRHG